MGIKGGASLINSNSKTVTANLADIPHNTRVCIDASEFIYRSLIKHGNNHVSGCLNLLEKLFRFGLLPLFVFDGTPPVEKQFVTDERRKLRAYAHEKLNKLKEDIKVLQKVYDTISSDSSASESLSSSRTEEEYNTLIAPQSEHTVECKNLLHNATPKGSLTNLSFRNGNDDVPDELTLCGISEENETHIKTKLTEHMNTLTESAEKERRKTVSLSDKQICDIMTLLDMFSIPYMALDIEADIVCAKLVKYGFVDYCISNDVDLLAFGCTKIIRNLKFRDDKIEIFSHDQIIDDLELSHDQFIDLCIIMGCDYAPRIIGIKPDLALALIKKYKCIEAVLDNFDIINTELDAAEPGKFIKLPDNFTYQCARNIFNDYDQTITYDILCNEFISHNFDNIEQACQTIKGKPSIYSTVFTYCRDKCQCLNASLIHKKINTVINYFNSSQPQRWRADIYKAIQRKIPVQSVSGKCKKVRSFP
jgi:5'-3' exonuclease